MVKKGEFMSMPDQYAAVCSKLLVTLTFQTEELAQAQVEDWEREHPQGRRDSEVGPYYYKIVSWAVPTGPRRADRVATPFETVELAEEYVELGNEDAVDEDWGGDRQRWENSASATKWKAMSAEEYALYLRGACV